MIRIKKKHSALSSAKCFIIAALPKAYLKKSLTICINCFIASIDSLKFNQDTEPETKASAHTIPTDPPSLKTYSANKNETTNPPITP